VHRRIARDQGRIRGAREIERNAEEERRAERVRRGERTPDGEVDHQEEHRDGECADYACADPPAAVAKDLAQRAGAADVRSVSPPGLVHVARGLL